MLLIKNIGVLQSAVGSFKHCGVQQGENIKLKNAAILVQNGVIKQIFENGELPCGAEGMECVDAGGRLVTSGLVDAHTHLVFGGWRQHEIPLKISGASYLDILRAGGGILDTVRKTREASEQELLDKCSAFLDEQLSCGVTTVEAKSGYGLDLETELKQLKVAKKLNESHAVDIVSTFLGAHAVPPEYKGREGAFIDYLCDSVLPQVAEQKLASYCDVFCEDSVFNVEHSKKMLLCAQKHGLKSKIHADEIEEIGGAVLAGEIGAISAEHLIATGEKGMDSMARGGTIAVLLPQTSFYLGKNYAQARKMIEKGIAVAIASDFNPGSCPSLNLHIAINLGYLKYRLYPEEVLTAVTINAACAIGKQEEIGTLEVGKKADIVIWNAPDFETLCYRLGSNLVHKVVKNGKII